MLQLEKNPKFPLATSEDTLFPCCNSRGNPSFTPQLERSLTHLLPLRKNPDFPLATHEEELLVTRCKSRRNPGSLPQLEMRPNSHTVTQEEP